MRRYIGSATFLTVFLASVCLAQAQGSLNAPTGNAPATAPGGTEGRAGVPNEIEAEKAGNLKTGTGIGVPPLPIPPQDDAAGRSSPVPEQPGDRR